jgi:hypothetical protein
MPYAFNISDGRMTEMIFETTSNPVVATNLGNADYSLSSSGRFSS